MPPTVGWSPWRTFCLSFCLSVRTRYCRSLSKLLNGCISFLVWRLPWLSYTALKVNSVPLKSGYFPLDLNVPNSGLEKFRHSTSIVASDVNLVRLTTVASLLIITWNIHLCVQHDGRDAARRAGPSALGETCHSCVFHFIQQIHNKPK